MSEVILEREFHALLPSPSELSHEIDTLRHELDVSRAQLDSATQTLLVATQLHRLQGDSCTCGRAACPTAWLLEAHFTTQLER